MDFGFLTGYEVCDLIREWVVKCKWETFSVAEILLSLNCPGVVRVADAFLSHCQAECIELTNRALYDTSQAIGVSPVTFSYFIDYFCIRQKAHGDFAPAAVREVIGTIKHAVLILTPYHNLWPMQC